MMFGELYTKEEMQWMIDNTRGFFNYCKLREQLEKDENAHSAFSWVFNLDFVPLPIDPEGANRLNKSDFWWIDRTIQKAIRRAWNTPAKFRNSEFKLKGEKNE